MQLRHKVIFRKTEPKEIYNNLVRIQKAFEFAEDEIIKFFPQIDTNKDARYLVYSLSKRTVQCYILSALFFKDSLANPNWWKTQKEISVPDLTNEILVEIISNYQEELKTGFLNSIYIHLEIFLRTIANNLIVAGSGKKKKQIHQLRDYILDKTSIEKDFGNLILIFQYIRNSFHYGGFHTNETAIVSYKNLEFSFIKETPASGVDWNDLEFLIRELIDFYTAISKSQVVVNIPFIEHPHSTIEPTIE